MGLQVLTHFVNGVAYKADHLMLVVSMTSTNCLGKQDHWPTLPVCVVKIILGKLKTNVNSNSLTNCVTCWWTIASCLFSGWCVSERRLKCAGRSTATSTYTANNTWVTATTLLGCLSCISISPYRMLPNRFS